MLDTISTEQLEKYYDLVVTNLIAFAPRLLLAVVVLIIGWWLIKRVVNLVVRALQHSAADAILIKFLRSLISIVLKALLLISVASMIGIATTSFIAVLGAAGLAIGLALQGSLSNFAGGVLILLFRPFKVGDFVEAQGVSGTVLEMQIFNTILVTPDNKRVIVPNGPLANDNITNYSAESTRRIDLAIGIGYDDDLKQAKTLLEQMVAADDRVLQDPAPLVVISELADSSVNFMVRVWVASEHYWPVTFDFNERVKLEFDAAGISIPYPQSDVHLHEQAAAG